VSSTKGKWAGHVASASADMIFIAETEGRDHFEDLRADAKAILQWI
jgi:hypothetical protein